MADPWAQLPGESDESYARFLIYRNLGPKRSLRKGYLHYLRAYDGYAGGVKGLHPPGCWYEDSGGHFWVDRAAAWDIRNLVAYGSKVAVLHVRAVTLMAEKNLRAVSRLSPGDDGWSGLVASMRLVSDFFTPDVVRGIQDRNQPARPALVPAGSERGRDRLE